MLLLGWLVTIWIKVPSKERENEKINICLCKIVGLYNYTVVGLPSKVILVAKWLTRRTSNPKIAGSSPAGDFFCVCFYKHKILI